MNLRIGQGIDIHPLEKGRDLMIGGVILPSAKGCVAHSDGDTLLHALCDSILGAAGLGDIGTHFPDSDDEFRGIDSKILLARVYSLVRAMGFTVVNADCTVCLESPRISPYIPEMRKIISSILETSPDNISIKATTAEQLGFIGSRKGMAAMAVTLLGK
jgi:2-C-methyl-D-erythritol 2,4-cyclodiphosphate synthase